MYIHKLKTLKVNLNFKTIGNIFQDKTMFIWPTVGTMYKQQHN